MGLDMWTYKIKKATVDDVVACSGKHYDEISNMGYSIFEMPANDGEKADIEDIIPYLQPVKIQRDKINMTQLRKDFEIPEDAHQSGYGVDQEGITLFFRKDDFSKRVSLTHEKLESYRVTVESTVYIAKELDEIQYWRKNYDLQETLYKAYQDEEGKSIVNCGYHLLTDNMMDIIAKANDNENRSIYNDSYFEPTDEEAVLYHEWY